MNNPIGILFTNFHPAEEIDGKMLPDEIEICLGIIPRYQNKHLGQTLEREISIKLLEMYPTEKGKRSSKNKDKLIKTILNLP